MALHGGLGRLGRNGRADPHQGTDETRHWSAIPRDACGVPGQRDPGMADTQGIKGDNGSGGCGMLRIVCGTVLISDVPVHGAPRRWQIREGTRQQRRRDGSHLDDVRV